MRRLQNDLDVFEFHLSRLILRDEVPCRPVIRMRRFIMVHIVHRPKGHQIEVVFTKGVDLVDGMVTMGNVGEELFAEIVDT